LFNKHHNFRITRKGISRTAAEWLLRVQPYVTQWETANTHVWQENVEFDLDEFDLYLQRYMSRTRLCIVQHTHPDDIPAPSTSDMYPSYDISGSRQYAVRYILFM
jgi:proteasome lid subunit RPN8/RPN11